MTAGWRKGSCARLGSEPPPGRVRGRAPPPANRGWCDEATQALLDVSVILLSDTYASTAIGPIEVFHSAGLLWNALNGTRPNPRFRVTVASLDGRAVDSAYALALAPQVSIRKLKKADIVILTASWPATPRSCPGYSGKRLRARILPAFAPALPI